MYYFYICNFSVSLKLFPNKKLKPKDYGVVLWHLRFGFGFGFWFINAWTSDLCDYRWKALWIWKKGSKFLQKGFCAAIRCRNALTTYLGVTCSLWAKSCKSLSYSRSWMLRIRFDLILNTGPLFFFFSTPDFCLMKVLLYS